jgi:hypothetical protein
MGIENVETKLEAIREQIFEAVDLTEETDIGDVVSNLNELETVLYKVLDVLDEILEKKAKSKTLYDLWLESDDYAITTSKIINSRKALSEKRTN